MGDGRWKGGDTTMSRIASALEALFYIGLGVITPYVALLLPQLLLEEYAMVGQTLSPWVIIGATLAFGASGPCVFILWISTTRTRVTV